MESIPFITTTDEGEFQVDERAVEYLESIQGRVAIIAVAGPWRTGKSFLLNQLLGIQGAGFVVGPTINACTKGIWLWGHPIVLEDGLSVVLMDTEGLGSTSRSQNEDCNIFSLALLLSSYFIWNSRGVIDGNALEDFALVVNITKHIHVRSQAVQNLGGTGSAASNEIAQLSQYFPSFMWVVRDFSLKLEENGRAISDRQYLEKALKPQGGFTEDSASRNQIRHLLSSFFYRKRLHNPRATCRRRKCFAQPDGCLTVRSTTGVCESCEWAEEEGFWSRSPKNSSWKNLKWTNDCHPLSGLCYFHQYRRSSNNIHSMGKSTGNTSRTGNDKRNQLVLRQNKRTA